MGKSIEQTTTATYTPGPDASQYPPRRTLTVQVFKEPKKRALISLIVPATGPRGGEKIVDLRDANDLRDLAEVAQEAYQDLVGSDHE